LIEHTLLISEVQQEIVNLPDRHTEDLEATMVTRGGKKVLAILPYWTYKALLETIESLQETLEIMQDPEMMAAIRQAEEDIKNGNAISLEDCFKELGWE
jgi:PHD/YefM family antitoxin component YafN of YafNO toxin-antitoxin module